MSKAAAMIWRFASRLIALPLLLAWGCASVQPTMTPDEVIGVHTNFREGGIIPAGETIITIDPRDYALAVIKAEAGVAAQALALAVEEGAGEIAARERNMLDNDDELSEVEEALILRKPHQNAAFKSFQAAQADLETARRNLARTRLTAPFTALILSRGIELGGLASPQQAAATVVDAATYWVRVALAVDRLAPVLNAPPHATTNIAVIAGNGIQATGRFVGGTGTVDI